MAFKIDCDSKTRSNEKSARTDANTACWL